MKQFVRNYTLYHSARAVRKESMVPETFPVPDYDPAKEIAAGRSAAHTGLHVRAFLPAFPLYYSLSGIPMECLSLSLTQAVVRLTRATDRKMSTANWEKKLTGSLVEVADRSFGLTPTFRITRAFEFLDCFYLDWELVTPHEQSLTDRDRKPYFGMSTTAASKASYYISDVDMQGAIFPKGDPRVTPGAVVCFPIATPKAWVVFEIEQVTEFSATHVQVKWALRNGHEGFTEHGFAPLPPATAATVEAYIKRWQLRHDPVNTEKEYATMMVVPDKELFAVAGEEQTLYFDSLAKARKYAQGLAGRKLFAVRWMPLPV